MEKSVLGLIARHNQHGGLVFYPGVKEKLSEESIREFMLCNEAFQHTALIHIHRRVRKVPASSPEVQYSVKRILACTSQIVPRSGLSPWVMLTTPLFTGGCEALGEDRDAFKQLLTSLHNTTRIPNVLQSLEFLEKYWAHGAHNKNEDWSHFLGMLFLMLMTNEGYMTDSHLFRSNELRLHSLLDSHMRLTCDDEYSGRTQRDIFGVEFFL